MKPRRDDEFSDEELAKAGIDRDRFKELMRVSTEFTKYLQRLRSNRSNNFHCDCCDIHIKNINNRVQSHMLSKRHSINKRLVDELRAQIKA